MFAISFDMLISDLKNHYGEVYNNAYYEIATTLEKFGFYRGQGSVYLLPMMIWLIFCVL